VRTDELPPGSPSARGRSRATTLVVTLFLFAAACGSSPSTGAIGAGLRGPSGLHAEVYARGMKQAASFAFDPQGRLWVATAAANDSGADAVYVVTKAGATAKKVIAGVHTPLGLLWHGDTLFVSSAGRVDTYSGFDGTAFASTTRIVSLPDGVGEVNGMVFGPDGRVHLGISSPCDHCTPASPYSAALVSFLPDGHDLRVDATGIRAPIDFAYYPGTSDLFVTMNQRDDLGAKTPGDWLAVVADGQRWGFPACYGQGGAACVGVPKAVATLDPHAAVSGIAIATGQLGSRVGTAAIVAEWAKGKVLRVGLHRHGAGYTGTVSTLLTGISNPVAVALGPDRALYVGDWSSGVVYRVARAAS